MRPQPLAPEHDNDRRNAIQDVGRLLDLLRQPAWATVVLDWLSRYDGLECYLWPEEDPVIEVRDLLQRYVTDGKALEAGQFSEALADLRFCYCAARHENSDVRWDPLHDVPFSAWTCGKGVLVWDSPTPWPTREMIHAWLLLRLSRTRTHLN